MSEKLEYADFLESGAYIKKLEETYNRYLDVRDKKLVEFMKENKELKEEIERLNNIINELEKDFERKIQSCTVEAEATTNDFYCRLHIATLKRWLNKIKELKGVDKE